MDPPHTFPQYRFADLAGYIARIGQFILALEDNVVEGPIHYEPNDEDKASLPAVVKVENLTYAASMDSSKAIVEGLTFTATPGRHVIISGRSGSGKSTALKVLAGLWEPLSGYRQVPSKISYFMPQSPYLVVGGTLKEQLAYPDPPESLSDAEMESLLKDAELTSLWWLAEPARDPTLAVQSQSSWSTSLSAGEKQRLAFARMLHRAPRFVFMDEGTVHLNPDLATRLLERALKRGITFIAVSHAPLPALEHSALFVNMDDFAVGQS